MPDSGNYQSELKRLGKSISSLFKMGVEDLKRGLDFASSAVWDGKAPAKQPPVRETFPDKVEPWAEAPPASATPEIIHVAPLTREIVEELVGPIDGLRPLDPQNSPEIDVEAAQADAKNKAILADVISNAAVRIILEDPDVPKASLIGPANPEDMEDPIVYAALTVDLADGGYRWSLAGIACYEGPGGHILARDARRLDLSDATAAKTEAEAYRNGLIALYAAVDASYKVNLMLDSKYVRNQIRDLEKRQKLGGEIKPTSAWAPVAAVRAGRQDSLTLIEKFDEEYSAFFIR